MAVFIIRAVDKTDPDPVKNKGLGKRGDIIDVCEDNKRYNVPPAPDYIIIRIPGLTKAECQKYTEPYIVDDVVEHKRLYRVLVDAATLPAQVKNKITQDRAVEIVWATARNFIQNKVTLATE